MSRLAYMRVALGASLFVASLTQGKAARAASLALDVVVEGQGCLSEPALEASLLRHLQSRKNLDDLRLSVVELDGEARIAVVQGERLVAERRLFGLTGSCQARNDAVALAASIAIDALLHEREEQASSSPARDARPASAALPKPVRDRAQRPPAGVSMLDRVRLFGGLGIVVQPSTIATRGDLAVAWKVRGPFFFSGRVFGEAAPRQAIGAGAISVQRFGAGAGLGARLLGTRWLNLAITVEPLLALQHVQGHDFALPRSQSKWEAAGSGALRAYGLGPISPWVEVGGRVWLREHQANAVEPDDRVDLGRFGLTLTAGVTFGRW